MIDVHCPVCHRLERWHGDDHQVVLEGGVRQPTLAPERAAFETWAAALRGETGPIAGPCAGCGQPLVADGPVPEAAPARVSLPGGGWLEIGPAGVRGPAGVVPLDEAQAEVRAAFPDGIVLSELRPGLVLVQSSMVTLMLAPIVALWVVAVGAVVLFLSNYGTVGPAP